MLEYAYDIALYYAASDIHTIITKNSFDNCPTAIKYQDGSTGAFVGRILANTFDNGNVGIEVTQAGSDLQAHGNQFLSLSSFGIQSSDSDDTVQAQRNWWADASGPSGEGSGTGTAVSAYIDFSDWSTTPEEDVQGVWNVLASRRGGTMVVDVYYDLDVEIGSTCTVSMKVSDTGGAPYDITPMAGSLSGDIGAGITPGQGLHIVWDAAYGGSGPYTDKMRVQLNVEIE